jgi:hypothetical protein
VGIVVAAVMVHRWTRRAEEGIPLDQPMDEPLEHSTHRD